MRILIVLISFQVMLIRGEDLWSRMSNWSKVCYNVSCFQNKLGDYLQKKRCDDIPLMQGVLLKRSSGNNSMNSNENLIESLLEGREMTIKLMDSFNVSQDMNLEDRQRKFGFHLISLKGFLLGLLFLQNALSSAKAAAIILFAGKAIILSIMAKFLLKIVIIKHLGSKAKEEESHYRSLSHRLSSSEFLYKITENFASISR